MIDSLLFSPAARFFALWTLIGYVVFSLARPIPRRRGGAILLVFVGGPFCWLVFAACAIESWQYRRGLRREHG